jgi:hypothetical protein
MIEKVILLQATEPDVHEEPPPSPDSNPDETSEPPDIPGDRLVPDAPRVHRVQPRGGEALAMARAVAAAVEELRGRLLGLVARARLQAGMAGMTGDGHPPA